VGALRIAFLRALFVAASLLCASANAFAAGLGRMEVLTALGAPLRAEVAVIADKNEALSLSAKIAPPAAFQNAGLVHSPVIADMRVVIEKRANGDPYISITTAKPLNEPVVDLLLELSWSSGRVIREYTAFVDPPYLIAEREKQRAAAAEQRPTTSAAPPQPAPKPEPLPEQATAPAEAPISTTPTDTATVPATEPAAPAPSAAPQEQSRPVETIGGTAPTLLLAEDGSAMPTVAGESYGPTKRGDTLSKIALASKPADVTLEQMLVLLFRNNPDAFSGKNMNRLKTGKIIRLPDPAEYGRTSAADARKEVRLQSADWNAYRERLAARAAQETPAEAPAQQAAAGEVMPKVEDKSVPAAQPKEVVRLSKGEPGAAAAGASGADRSKALEEELVARDKALRESNERVAKLEKTVKDLQALVEVKNQGMAELQRQAAGAAPAATPPAKPVQPSTAAPGATAQPAPATPPAKPTAPAQPSAPATSSPGAQPAPPPGPGPAQPATPPASSAPQAAPPPAPAPAQQARPRPTPPPPPPPEPSLLDNVLSQPTYLVAGVLLIGLVGLLAVRTVRRRREVKAKTEEVAPAIAGYGVSGAGATYAAPETDPTLATQGRDVSEEVDPLEEAEIFLAYGRDTQAEELLKEAIAANPRRYETHAKLLEIYAKRKDLNAFEQIARDVQQGTGGQGEVWARVAGLGYQIDPQNPRYAAGRGVAQSIPEEPTEPSAAERLDFEVGLRDSTESSSTVTDIDLGDTGQLERTHIMPASQVGAGEATEPGASSVDLNIDLPAAEPSAPSSNAIDFNFDIDKLSPAEPAAAPASATAASAGDGGLDFDIGTLSIHAGGATEPSTSATPSIDLSGISLDLGATTSPSASSTGKNEKWYEVQTKFDLAKAYQEMGDKDGAREILKEVIAEGDTEQKAAAQAVLASLE